ncbi:MAG: hypothetical protein SYR96_17795, partial [Actinomycetota bacterium]|nr:hypothetical protein [Actinomycetota bacterium]
GACRPANCRCRPAKPARTTAYAYRPATNRWRRLPPLEVGRSAHVAVWTGSRLIVWGGYTRGAVNAEPTKPAHGLILDPVAGRWSPMPQAPIHGRRDATAFWTGSRMLVWGGYTVGDNPTGLLDGASYRAP